MYFIVLINQLFVWDINDYKELIIHQWCFHAYIFLVDTCIFMFSQEPARRAIPIFGHF